MDPISGNATSDSYLHPVMEPHLENHEWLDHDDESGTLILAQQQQEEKLLVDGSSKGLNDLDLSVLRGMQPPEDDSTRKKGTEDTHHAKEKSEVEGEEALEALAELVPGLKTGKIGAAAVNDPTSDTHINDPSESKSVTDPIASDPLSYHTMKPTLVSLRKEDLDLVGASDYREKRQGKKLQTDDMSLEDECLSDHDLTEDSGRPNVDIPNSNSRKLTTLTDTHSWKKDKENFVKETYTSSDDSTVARTTASFGDPNHSPKEGYTPLPQDKYGSRVYPDGNGNPAVGENYPPPLSIDRQQSLGTLALSSSVPTRHEDQSSASLSTATQTHEVRMPMYLPTFKPATGCTNASDFIVRCFVARLRSGITVVKHGRSRWCKSRLRILHVHSDGRSLSWKPALGEPSSSKRPPKLDLSTCEEVRHAWSPDPLNPMFTGSPMLRQKCEAANAHKSFALIFPKRTVDITAVTADQCKVLMEGFSALCFRLQVANLAGRKMCSGSMNEDGGDDDRTTASVTLTNNSTGVSHSGGNVFVGDLNRVHGHYR